MPVLVAKLVCCIGVYPALTYLVISSLTGFSLDKRVNGFLIDDLRALTSVLLTGF